MTVKEAINSFVKERYCVDKFNITKIEDLGSNQWLVTVDFGDEEIALINIKKIDAGYKILCEAWI